MSHGHREWRSRHRGTALVGAIEALRPEGLNDRVSTLRLLDAALWMNLSRSVHVRSIRTL